MDCVEEWSRFFSVYVDALGRFVRPAHFVMEDSVRFSYSERSDELATHEVNHNRIAGKWNQSKL
jgi:hypothetical protein